MNPTAGSDPSLNFPKPIPSVFSRLPYLQNHQQPNNQRPLHLRENCQHTHSRPKQRGHPWGIATCLIRIIIFPIPHPSNRQLHPGSLARHYSTLPHLTLPTTHCENRLHRIRFYPYCEHRPHLSLELRTLSDPIAARLHPSPQLYSHLAIRSDRDNENKRTQSPDLLPLPPTNALVI